LKNIFISSPQCREKVLFEIKANFVPRALNALSGRAFRARIIEGAAAKL